MRPSEATRGPRDVRPAPSFRARPRYAASRNVASDGTAHYYAHVSATTGFLAKWAGDGIYVASAATSRTATASATGQTRFSVACDEFLVAQDPDSGKAPVAHEVWIRVGNTVTFTLCSNASTGFSSGAPRYDHTALALKKHWSTPLKTAMPGAAGNESWTFKVLRVKNSTVSVQYSRPRTGGEKTVWILTLKVHGQKQLHLASSGGGRSRAAPWPRRGAEPLR
jgi:predicted secreted protein